MVRRRGKKALYEVIGRSYRPHPGSTLEQLHPEKAGEAEPATEKPLRVSGRAVKWPRRPRIVQFNAGRIELSVPYQLAIAILLGVVLLVLVFYRLGQISSPAEQATVESAEELPGSGNPEAGRGEADMQTPPVVEKTMPATTPVEEIGPKGDNRIVIQTYRLRAHLEPAKEYFAQLGIETEIKKIGQWYYLVTMDKYENPKKPGTDGYFAVRKIIELGAKYKAPQGYETFGPKPFHDAYGMKFED